MISPITNSPSARDVALTAQSGRNVSEYQGHTFGRHLRAATVETDDAVPSETDGARQNSVNRTDSGQNSATRASGAGPASVSPSTAFIVNYGFVPEPAAQPAPGPAPANDAPPADPLEAAASALTDALEKNGIDPSTVSIKGHNDVVTYPGGYYINDLLTVTVEGKPYDFDASMTLQNPDVTVADVKKVLDGTWS